MIFTRLKTRSATGLFLFCIMLVMAGCSSRQAAKIPQAVDVKAMQVIKRDTPVTYTFVGQVEAKEEAQVRAKASGNIIARMVEGGATVTQGQPLFQIDRRQYEAALLTAQAQLAQSEATLSNTRIDTDRYRKLADQQAIAQQVLDNALTAERQNMAVVEANRARVQQAENDLADTLIVAPFTGRLDVNILNVGSFVQAGQTVLATVSSVNPVLVRFTMSENEYLRFVKSGRSASDADWSSNLKLILSDGSEYPLTGRVEQTDRGLAQETGTLTMKAVFGNPQKILIPGMFARISTTGEQRQGALLIPQRAVQQLLGKTLVTLVDQNGKAESRPVKMGPKVGSMWVVEEGLTEADRVVVEGFAKAPPGTMLNVTMIGEAELLKLPQ